jgi:hypothetical protein
VLTSVSCQDDPDLTVIRRIIEAGLWFTLAEETRIVAGGEQDLRQTEQSKLTDASLCHRGVDGMKPTNTATSIRQNTPPETP